VSFQIFFNSKAYPNPMQINPNRPSSVVKRQTARQQASSAARTENPDKVSLTSSPQKTGRSLDTHFQAILKHSVEKVSAELSGLPAGQLMFHGSEASFDKVEPRPSTRRDSDGTVKWEGSAIFAAMDPRVALHYTGNHGNGYSRGIDLINPTSPHEPITYGLYGGENLEDAMNYLYGDPNVPESCQGHMYLLDKNRFVKEPGLGSMEMVSRDVESNLGRFTINRRAAIDELVRSGDVRLDWRPR
jgi:hypothetical protein